MIRRRTAAAALLALSMGAFGTASASASSSAPGTRSLASVLTADGDRFDRNWYDYDIVTEAVLAVLAAKPTSPVSVLTKGDVALTAFIPNDRAFQVLALDLTHRWIGSEKGVFEALVATLGVDTIEKVLLYHVVPGATIDSATALRSDGARLATALPGASITVDVGRWSSHPYIRLIDNDRTDWDPFVNLRAVDINLGNQQIAHGIVFVLRPVDL